jgi:glycosyltransferase involved in cell wall biosynthesis
MLEDQGIGVTAIGLPRGRVTLFGMIRLMKAIRAHSPDVIQTWMYHSDFLGGIAARSVGFSNICWGIHHSDLRSAGTARSTVAVARLCSLLSRYVPRRIIFCATKSAMVHRQFGYDTARTRVVPNGYDLSMYEPCSTSRGVTRIALELDSDYPVIGFVARYDPLKDHETLLQALHYLSARGIRPTCLLVGSGMDGSNSMLVDRVRQLGLMNQVRLLGRRVDIPAIMNTLDLHVMSSASEAFPNVLAEAMACGTPCVSTDVGDAAEILGDTGWIVPTHAPEALADAIAHALAERSNAEWETRRQAARDRIEHNFSIEKMVNRYRSIWFDTAN